MLRHDSVAPIGMVIEVLTGYASFFRRGRTPIESFYRMRNLYCITDGKFNDIVAWITGLFHPPYPIKKSSGPTGNIRAGEIEEIVSMLKRQGFCVFEQKLPENLCDELVRFALETPATVLPVSSPGRDQSEYPEESVVYDRNNIISPKYALPMQAVAENLVAQRLLIDEKLLAIAQSYLGTKPVIDLMTMWWSTSFLKGPSSEAAQLFHFDMDRIKFLKFFFYLTDVSTDTGPHVYVRGSHRHKPGPLRKDGRIPDDEIARFYQPSDIVEITGPRGTIIAADTRGFHKGKPPVRSDRLVLEIEYATDLFGWNYPHFQINDRFSSEFMISARRYKRAFSNFIAEPC